MLPMLHTQPSYLILLNRLQSISNNGLRKLCEASLRDVALTVHTGGFFEELQYCCHSAAYSTALHVLSTSR